MRSLPLFWILCVAVSGLLPGTKSYAQSLVSISVKNVRPVFATLVELERKGNFTVTYEDPLMTFEDDARAFDEDFDLPHGDGRPRLLVSSGRVLTTSYSSEMAQQPERTLELIKEVLRQASDAGYKFDVRQVGPTVFHVFPVMVRDATGVERTYIPLLDTRITMPAQDRTGMEFLTEVLRQVTRIRGVPMHYGPVMPIQLLKRKHLAIGATNEMAGDLIRRLFGDAARWSLECLPRDSCFFKILPGTGLPTFSERP